MGQKEYLTADEVDFRTSLDVYGLGESRYVVRTEEDDGEWERKRGTKHATDALTPAPTSTGSTAVNPAPTERRPDLAGISDPYAVDVDLKTDAGVAAFTTSDDDIQAVFVAMLRWYAGRVEPSLPPERVVEVLLQGTEFDPHGGE